MFQYELKTKDISKNNEILNPNIKIYINGVINDMGYILEPNIIFKFGKKDLYKTMYKVDKSILNSFNTKKTHIVSYCTYLIATHFNDQKVIMLIQNDTYMFIQVPYTFSDDLYETFNIFKCFINLEKKIISIYDIYVYRNDVLDEGISNKLKLLEKINQCIQFDFNHTYDDPFDLTMLNYIPPSNIYKSNDYIYVSDDLKHIIR